MKRDWDVIRAIMLKLEESEGLLDEVHAEDVPGYPRDLVNYNMILMNDAKLAEGYVRENIGMSPQAAFYRLTFAGHELLDQIRPKTTWNRIKQYIAEHGADMSLETIKITAPIVLRAMLGA